MAATGKTPILLYGSTTPTNAPVAGNLTNSSDGCEIAINVADKNLFFKDSTNAVNTVPIRQSSASSNGWLSSTDWNTFNNKSPAAGSSSITTVGTITSGTWNGSTIDVAHGGTGLTSLTANYIPYGNGTGAFSSSGNFYYNGTDLNILNGGAKVGGVIWTGGGAAFGNNGVGMWFDTGSNTGYLRSYNAGVDWRDMVYNAKTHQFQTNDNNVVKIHNSGGVSIGNTTDPGAGNFTIDGATATKASGTTWANPSDIRLKENIQDFTKGLVELLQINPCTWEYNGKGGTTAGTKGIGVIADDVENILPESVDTYMARLDNEYEEPVKRFDATEITWLLVNAVKQLSYEISVLRGNK